MTVLETLTILEAACWSVRRETSTRQKLKTRWIYWSRTFAHSGSFHSFAIMRLNTTAIAMLRVKASSLEVRMDSLARKFHETHDMKVKDELERLLKAYGKLKEPWKFVVI